MKISGRMNYLAALESVAMTDIVLNMFIFFFISFSLLYTFNQHKIKQIEVKLPKAENAQTIKTENQLNISITAEGAVYLDGEPVTKKELKDRTRASIKKSPDIAVIVHSDKLARFKEVVSVLDALTEAGAKGLNIAAAAD